jgi:hypothetical protein
MIPIPANRATDRFVAVAKLSEGEAQAGDHRAWMILPAGRSSEYYVNS